jgi:hypothetical protein
MDWYTEEPRFDFRKGREIFFFFIASILAVGPLGAVGGGGLSDERMKMITVSHPVPPSQVGARTHTHTYTHVYIKGKIHLSTGKERSERR